jgi:hypothetical protein
MLCTSEVRLMLPTRKPVPINASTIQFTSFSAISTPTSEPTSSTNGLNPDSKPQNPPNLIAIIVGSAVGGVVFLLLLILICCLWRRRAAKRRLSGSDAASFHRDMMIRSNASTPAVLPDLKLKDSQVFKFDTLLATGIGFPGKAASHRSSSAKSSPSIDDDERTPSLARYSSTYERSPGKLNDFVSPASISVYSAQTSDTPYGNRPRIAARTDRQMNIQEEIMELRRQMIGKSDASLELDEIREKIRGLEELHGTDWALELTDTRPPGLEEGRVGVAL